MKNIPSSHVLATIMVFSMLLAGQKVVDDVESALACGECHEDIYNQWSKSRHARSTPSANVLFAKIYELSQKDTNGETKLYCIRCHAPVSQINGDLDLRLPITNEGITCDICHSIKELTDIPAHWPNRYEPGKVKRGARKDAKPKVHKTAYSELFENGRMCTGCHGDMLNIPGTRSCGNLTICDTDFEWQSTIQAAEGKSCETCHMDRFPGKSADMGPDRKDISQHDFPGAYSKRKLQSAARMELDVQEFGGQIIASVRVINSGTAHLLPTGPPARLMYVKVTGINGAGEEVWTNFSDNPASQDPFGVFHIVFANQEGKVPAMPWLASRIVKDTRLRPGENRQLIYKFRSDGIAAVSAKLFYRLAPPALLDKFEITDETLRKAVLLTQVEKTIPVQ